MPERAELEQRQFELELERIKGRSAYLEPDDLGIMYGLLLGDIESNESSQAVSVIQLSSDCTVLQWCMEHSLSNCACVLPPFISFPTFISLTCH